MIVFVFSVSNSPSSIEVRQPVGCFCEEGTRIYLLCQPVQSGLDFKVSSDTLRAEVSETKTETSV